MTCSKCGQYVTSGYRRDDVTICVRCSHSEPWHRRIMQQPRQNAAHAREDARLDSITADEELDRRIRLRL
jgi:hypothetical protein